MKHLFGWLEKNKDIGVLLLRIFIGLRLIYGVQDNILSWSRMLEFRDFLQKFHFPFPIIAAVISVYAQFVTAVMILIGWNTRYAAIILVINFMVAWVMVDRHSSIEEMTPALTMLFCSLLFLFQGAGKFSIGGK
jgi:putative oxidoreductase